MKMFKKYLKDFTRKYKKTKNIRKKVKKKNNRAEIFKCEKFLKIPKDLTGKI